MSRSSNGSGQNATNVQIRVRVPSGIPEFVEWWPSGKGTSLSMRTRWVRLPSTSPKSFCPRRLVGLGSRILNPWTRVRISPETPMLRDSQAERHSALTRENEGSNPSPAAIFRSAQGNSVVRGVTDVGAECRSGRGGGLQTRSYPVRVRIGAP